MRERARVLACHPARAAWRTISAPVDGALVLMGKVAGAETHCGTWLAEDGGLILHTDEPHGVALDPPLELAQSRRWRLNYLIPAEEKPHEREDEGGDDPGHDRPDAPGPDRRA
ncbi:hypothetical protein [Methylobacterium trifolii]|uniref:hypothetical protein n=1 Tax=Methylobacterium trifolii TaxID=1003092 RepID=UPI001EDCA6B2|nr:hypothetical protein [Methylobacterium trifolii]